jgi:hypothetical protein
LDNATATTIPLDDETLLASGGAAYTVLARARAVTETVTLADQVPLSAQIIAWAKLRLADFEAGLQTTAARSRSVPWVTLPRLDRYDGEWQ